MISKVSKYTHFKIFIVYPEIQWSTFAQVVIQKTDDLLNYRMFGRG